MEVLLISSTKGLFDTARHLSYRRNDEVYRLFRRELSWESGGERWRRDGDAEEKVGCGIMDGGVCEGDGEKGNVDRRGGERRRLKKV